MDAVSDRDYVVDYAYSNTMIMMHLSRISEELILWMNPQFKLIEIDEGFALVRLSCLKKRTLM